MFNVCFAADDNYSSYLDIVLISLFENNNFDKINVFILDSGISDENINIIKNTCSKYGGNVSFINVENIEDKFDISLNKMKVKGNFSLATYSRLFLVSLLPNDVDKVLYLDCDALILGSFEPIWNLDLSDYLAGGVLALNGNDDVKKAIDLAPSDKYINAGMLLVNLKNWREENIEEKLLEELIRLNNKGIHFGMDQGVINSVLKGRIYVLNPEFNLEGSLHNTGYDITMKLHNDVQQGYYDKSTLDNAIKNPVFKHFCVGPGEFYNRPWLNPYHENKKEYENYFNKSSFEKEQVFFYQEVPFIKRFNRSLARNDITKFLIVKFVPDSLCEKIIGNKNNSSEKIDVERW